MSKGWKQIMKESTCFYKLQITGEPAKVTLLKEILCSNYNYSKHNFGVHGRHFFGLKDCEVIEEAPGKVICSGFIEKDGYQIFSEHSLSFQRYLQRGILPINKKDKRVPFHGTSMERETSGDLVCEVFVEDSKFHQHLIFQNGKLTLFDTIDYECVYWDKELFPTIDAFNDSLADKEPFTINRFNPLNGCFERGGFEWVFGQAAGEMKAAR